MYRETLKRVGANTVSCVTQQLGVGGPTWEGPQEEANLKSNFKRVEK